MNIVYLKYAVAVAKAGSLSKAADELFIAQPNLSRAIKELEKELNVTIFERNPKGISLTPEGEEVISYGKKILRSIDDFEAEFKNGQSKKTVFSISVPRASYISRAFADFTEGLTPDKRCEVYYKETNNLRAVTNIIEKDYKLGIIRYAERYDKYFKEMLDEKNLRYELIAEFKYVLLMSKDCPLASKPTIRYEDLAGYIQIAHADPYVPSVSMSEIKKEELPDNFDRCIFLFERASQFDVLSENRETFMWVAPVPTETLERFGLVQRSCPDNDKKYRDVLIYPERYRLSDLDKSFITALIGSKRKYLKEEY